MIGQKDIYGGDVELFLVMAECELNRLHQEHGRQRYLTLQIPREMVNTSIEARNAVAHFEGHRAESGTIRYIFSHFDIAQ
jgi:hypothetical protein